MQHNGSAPNRSYTEILQRVGGFAVAIGAAGAISFVFLSGSFSSLLSHLYTTPSSLYAVQALTAVGVVLLGLLWIVVGYGEVHQVNVWLADGSYFPNSPWATPLVLLIVGVLFAGLFVNVLHFTTFIGVYAALCVMDLLLSWLRTLELRQALDSIKYGRRFIGRPTSREAVRDIFAGYYFSKGRFVRLLGNLLISICLFIAFLLCDLGYVKLRWPDSELYAFGYAVWIVNLLTSETVVWFWRLRMNSRLGELARRLPNK